jgi:hypothetical protein
MGGIGFQGFRFQCSGVRDNISGAYMKLRMRLRQTGVVTPPDGRKDLNVEHRTPNIERRILMTLRFIDFITSEPQPALSRAESKFEV